MILPMNACRKSEPPEGDGETDTKARPEANDDDENGLGVRALLLLDVAQCYCNVLQKYGIPPKGPEDLPEFIHACKYFKSVRDLEHFEIIYDVDLRKVEKSDD